MQLCKSCMCQNLKDPNSHAEAPHIYFDNSSLCAVTCSHLCCVAMAYPFPVLLLWMLSMMCTDAERERVKRLLDLLQVPVVTLMLRSKQLGKAIAKMQMTCACMTRKLNLQAVWRHKARHWWPCKGLWWRCKRLFTAC